jgi:hypothetical protein
MLHPAEEQPQAFPSDVPPDICGMMLRDYFAAKAMQAFIASDYEGAAGHDAKCAEWAYAAADAMLAARVKGVE